MAGMPELDNEFLEALRTKDKNAWDRIVHDLLPVIRFKLYWHGLSQTRELMDTVLEDVFLDLANKKNPIVITSSTKAYLVTIVDFIITSYISKAK